jgi:hypothetical protein
MNIKVFKETKGEEYSKLPDSGTAYPTSRRKQSTIASPLFTTNEVLFG